MTFLLFVVSVAVLEYLLRNVGQKPDGAQESSRPVEDIVEYAQSDTSTADLCSLGRALDAQKADKTPDTSSALGPSRAGI
jgi:hypothetical protein